MCCAPAAGSRSSIRCRPRKRSNATTETSIASTTTGREPEVDRRARVRELVVLQHDRDRAHRGEHEHAAFAAEHYRARIHPTLLEDAPLQAGSFDLCTSSHVFEHLRTPDAAFARVHALLKPGGHFHIHVPDISDPRRTPSARWHFGHVHGFTRKTLAMLAWKCGFEVLPQSPPDGPHLLLRRLDQAVSDWQRHPGHAEEMRRFFAEHTSLRHFTSATPYQRFFRRMARFRREKRDLRSR